MQSFINSAHSRLVVEESAKREEEEQAKAEHDRQQRLRDETEGLKPEEVPGGGGIGSISFVSCATGDGEEGQAAAAEQEQREESLHEEMEKGEWPDLCVNIRLMAFMSRLFFH